MKHKIKGTYERDKLDVCPNCGGPADNGHDRCVPPAQYYCKKCMKKYNKYSCIGDHEY